jgi:hypothetical protein
MRKKSKRKRNRTAYLKRDIIRERTSKKKHTRTKQHKTKQRTSDHIPTRAGGMAAPVRSGVSEQFPSRRNWRCRGAPCSTRNLISLLCCCASSAAGHKMLVYPYFPNDTLEHFLFGVCPSCQIFMLNSPKYR